MSIRQLSLAGILSLVATWPAAGQGAEIVETPWNPVEAPAEPQLPDPMADLIETVLDPAYVASAPPAPNIFGSTAILSGSEAASRQARRLESIAWPPNEGPWGGLVQRVAQAPRRDQLAAVNVWVNRQVTDGFDLDIYGQADYWASIEETFALRRGDCEDFAIAKMQLLEALGFSRGDLYLAVVKDEIRGVDHAVLAVRDGGTLWILDSLSDQLRPSEEVVGYRPVMTFSSGHAWIHGYRRGPGQEARVTVPY